MVRISSLYNCLENIVTFCAVLVALSAPLEAFSSEVQEMGTGKGKTRVLGHWSFDGDPAGYAVNAVSGQKDAIMGKYEYKEGVNGKALSFDGFRTYVKTKGINQRSLSDGFTIEAWIAPAMYPWAMTPVYDCSDGGAVRGFSFGIDELGHIGMKVAVRSTWYSVLSKVSVPLRKWTHIAGVFKGNEEVAVYMNGEKVASTPVEGLYAETFSGRGATIGRAFVSQVWKESQMSNPNAFFFMDGLLDEVILSAVAKTGDEMKSYASKPNLPEPSLTERGKFPKGKPGSFGAYYTRLDYYKEWDDMWRVGDKPDVFIRFEDSPVQFVFWRGASFVPCWVSENDIWCTNEWLETWGGDVVSCAEPLMDRQARHSHVRIIENTDARVVVHWRYALVDALYNFVAVSDDGRGEWCDEYHIIYPDHVGIRRMDLHYSKPERKHDWVEQIILTAPGQYPDDLIEKESITLMNMNGDRKDYVWNDSLKVKMEDPKKANISYVNLKADYCPFFVIPPDPVKTVEGTWDSPFFRTYAACQAMGGFRPNPVPSAYGWWNHWPVAQIPGDGRWVITPDKPGHFNLTTFVQWNDYSKTDKTRTRIMLQGMTDKKDEVVKVAKSWLNAPEMTVASRGFAEGKYDDAERAYVLEKTASKQLSLKLAFQASDESPLINPAIIVKNWGNHEAELYVDGKIQKNPEVFKQGIRKGEEGDDLILWIRMDKKSQVEIEIK